MHHFSTEEAVKFGWKTTKENFAFFFKVLLILLAIEIVSSMIGKSLESSGAKDLVNFLFWVVQVVINIGLVKIALKFYDHKKADFADLYDHYPLFLNYFLGSVLTGFIVMIGLILLIIPGIIFSIRLQFVSYLIIDRNLGPVEAVKKSWNMTKNHIWDLFLFGLVIGLVNVLGFLALGIGLLWTIPTTSLATAFVYRKFSPKS